jgi:protoporphyrinogen oxidase
MRIGILGAGLSGISLAYLLQEQESVGAIDLLEKERRPGGLCRSFPFANLCYDVGPHIMFSKNAEVLDLMVKMLGDNVHKLRRSNKIFHDGRFVKYPFENGLSALSAHDCDYCLTTFLNNPYSQYVPESMLQFFLATFGEGMTNLYLRPYNEKIWKFDPAFMDTQMVERIPKPPPEDVLRSAQGASTEGYVHQLYFYYPKCGGIQSLVNGFLAKLRTRVTVRSGAAAHRITRTGGCWRVTTTDGIQREYDRLVSTIPIPLLIAALEERIPQPIVQAASRLRFNSIAICALQVRSANVGDNFAITLADKNVLFHRLTKLNFLLPPEIDDGSTTLLAEVTYRAGDMISKMHDSQLMGRVIDGLIATGLLGRRDDLVAEQLSRFEHAYVIYDLDHRRNVDMIRKYCEGELGIVLHGRFGEFEYINMDAVIERSLQRNREWQPSTS